MSEFDITKAEVKDDFDVKAALSGRDKKIEELAKENSTLQASLKSTASDLESKFSGELSSLKELVQKQAEENARLMRVSERESLKVTEEDYTDGDLNISAVEKIAKSAHIDEIQSLKDKIAELEKGNNLEADLNKKLDDMARNNTRNSLNLDARINDEDFIKWATDTDFDMSGTKVLTKLADAEEVNDSTTMRRILQQYDSLNKETLSDVLPNTHSTKVEQTPEAKKVLSKIDELAKQRTKISKDMSQEGALAKVRDLTDQIAKLHGQVA